jgi:hypothetical protein
MATPYPGIQMAPAQGLNSSLTDQQSELLAAMLRQGFGGGATPNAQTQLGINNFSKALGGAVKRRMANQDPYAPYQAGGKFGAPPGQGGPGGFE